MARTVDQERRAALLSAVADAFVAAGTDRASLRDLAPEVGASARMLMHHFGSRDELVAMALEVARDRQLAAAEQAIVPGPDAVAVLHATWGWFMRPDTRQYFALFTDVAARERGEPGPERRFTARLGADWQPIFEAVFGADERFARNSSTLALLVVGVLRGMALDLTSGSDTDDHRRAFATLIELIASGGSEE